MDRFHRTLFYLPGLLAPRHVDYWECRITVANSKFEVGKNVMFRLNISCATGLSSILGRYAPGLLLQARRKMTDQSNELARN